MAESIFLLAAPNFKSTHIANDSSS